MLEINTYITYGGNGVCRISDIRQDKLCGTRNTYYVLTPLSGGGATIFVPVDNAALVAKMQPLPDEAEALALIDGLRDAPAQWIADNRERGEYYESVLTGGSRMALLSMIRSIYEKRRELGEKSRRLWTVDENALKKAEKIINEEFSLALGIAPERVPAFIRERLCV